MEGCWLLQNALNIPAEEVEVWIVRAIGKKLLDARIDQPGQLICYSHVANSCCAIPMLQTYNQTA